MASANSPFQSFLCFKKMGFHYTPEARFMIVLKKEAGQKGLLDDSDTESARAAFEAGEYAFTMYGNDLPKGVKVGR